MLNLFRWILEDQHVMKEMQVGTDAWMHECVKCLRGGWRNKGDIDEINKVLFTFSLCSLFRRRQIQNVLFALTSVGNACQKGTWCTERVAKECQKTLCWDSKMNKTWSAHHLRGTPNHTHTHATTEAHETKCKFWKSKDMTACAAGKYSERFGPIIYCLVLLRQLVLKCSLISSF